MDVKGQMDTLFIEREEIRVENEDDYIEKRQIAEESQILNDHLKMLEEQRDLLD